MNNTYTPPQKKVVTSLGLEQGVRDWLDENAPNKSYLVNELLKRHIRRENAKRLATQSNNKSEALAI